MGGLSIAELGKLTGTLAILLYGFGFLVVSTHNAKFGIRDYDLFRPTYLVAGVLFSALCGIFYYIVGRSVLTLDDSRNVYENVFTRQDENCRFWPAMVVIFPLVEVGFNTVLAAFVTKLFFVGPSLRSEAYLVLPIGLYYFWINSVFTSKVSEHVSRETLLYITAFNVAGIATLYYIADDVLIALIILFIGVSASLSGLVVQRKAFGTFETRAITIWWVAITIITAAGLFGGLVYGDARPALGGGKPQTAQIIFSTEKQLPSEIKERLSVHNGISMPVTILSEAPDGLVVSPLPSTDTKKFVLKIDRAYIAGTMNSLPSAYIKLE